MSMSLSIKDVRPALVRELRRRAKRNRRSMQGELLHILETALERPTSFDAFGLQRDIRALGLRTPAEAVRMIREDRDR
jgi:hypothetical protein